MQVVALNWHVYLLTHSALALGFVGLTRVLPIIAFSLVGGVVADRRDRRRVMLAAQTGMALVALALASLTYLGPMSRRQDGDCVESGASDGRYLQGVWTQRLLDYS